MTLDAQQQALARSRLYGLLARLIIRGIDELSLARLRELGWMGSPDWRPEGSQVGPLQEQHHAIFSLGVFPYAGVFLDPSASAGGLADRVRDHYERAGFRPLLNELSADHLGVELAYLSFVTGAQADALEDGRAEIAEALDHQLAEFLDACVLSYLPALVVAAQDLPTGDFWVVLLGEALELIAEHRARLPGPITPVALPEPEDLLADERTGLRRIAEHLLTPAHSGVFSSRADIAALGRSRELPRGFGSRVSMLENLLRSAVDYAQLAPLLATLDDLLAGRDHSLARLAAAMDIELAVSPWRDALARTRALLDRIARSALAPDQPWTSKPSTTTQPAP